MWSTNLKNNIKEAVWQQLFKRQKSSWSESHKVNQKSWRGKSEDFSVHVNPLGKKITRGKVRGKRWMRSQPVANWEDDRIKRVGTSTGGGRVDWGRRSGKRWKSSMKLRKSGMKMEKKTTTIFEISPNPA